MHYKELFKLLYEEQVRYLLCGGMAVNIYGIPRMTADIDIILDFEKENLKRFEKSVKELNYQKTIPVELFDLLDIDKRNKLITQKNLIVFSYYSPASSYMNIDVLVDVPIPFNEMWANKEEREIDNGKIYLISIEQLIQLKEYSNRIQDRQDIIHLTKLIKN